MYVLSILSIYVCTHTYVRAHVHPWIFLLSSLGKAMEPLPLTQFLHIIHCDLYYKDGESHNFITCFPSAVTAAAVLQSHMHRGHLSTSQQSS